MKELILASQSPRRRELLAKCTERFTVEAADIEETMPLLASRDKVELWETFDIQEI